MAPRLGFGFYSHGGGGGVVRCAWPPERQSAFWRQVTECVGGMCARWWYRLSASASAGVRVALTWQGGSLNGCNTGRRGKGMRLELPLPICGPWLQGLAAGVEPRIGRCCCVRGGGGRSQDGWALLLWWSWPHPGTTSLGPPPCQPRGPGHTGGAHRRRRCAPPGCLCPLLACAPGAAAWHWQKECGSSVGLFIVCVCVCCVEIRMAAGLVPTTVCWPVQAMPPFRLHLHVFPFATRMGGPMEATAT